MANLARRQLLGADWLRFVFRHFSTQTVYYQLLLFIFFDVVNRLYRILYFSQYTTDAHMIINSFLQQRSNKQQSKCQPTISYCKSGSNAKKNQGNQQGSITLADKTLRFKYFKNGDKPPGGYSLVFGLHGGGGCPTPVNDQQYSNHMNLYQGLLPQGVIWCVPRSCQQASDMWWKNYLPDFFAIIIKGFVLKQIVNSNKIFVTGYSAGGDGIYHLGPMLADWLAGAAMMAGHPNGVELYNVRNIAFSIQVGGQDQAYNRNNQARKYIETMQQLNIKYGGYSTKYCNVFQECSHWMNKKDASIFNNFLNQNRNPCPEYIVFKQHPRINKKYFYYIQVDPQSHKQLLIVRKQQNNFYIQSQIMPVSIFVNRFTVKYSQQVKIWHNNTLTICRKPERNDKIIKSTIKQRLDPMYIFEDCFVSIPINGRMPFAQTNQNKLQRQSLEIIKKIEKQQLMHEKSSDCCNLL